MISSRVRSNAASMRGSLPSPRAVASSANSRGARRYSTEKPSRQALWPSAQASHDFPAVTDPVAACEFVEQRTVQTARCTEVGVLDHGALTQPSVAEPSVETLVVARSRLA